MEDLSRLTYDLIERWRRLPVSRGKARVDNRWVLSGIVFGNRNGMRWRDALSEYGFYNRWKRRGEAGVFEQTMERQAAAGAEPQTMMVDVTSLKVHRTASIDAGRACGAHRL